jgi:hypothetical protein
MRRPDGRGRVHSEPGPDLNTATNGSASIDDNGQASRFVDALWSDGLGWACVAMLAEGRWREHFYRWPAERDDLLAQAMEAASQADVYMAPALRSQRRRTKDTAIPGRWAWADVDVAPEETVDRLALLGAMLVVSGSPRSFHCYLPLAEAPEDVEELELWNRRLARFLEADVKHDASVVLRLPGTWNRKAPTLPRPVVLERLAGAPWSRDDLDELLPVVEVVEPALATVDLDSLRLISTRQLPIELLTLAAEVPDPDRSGQSWRLVARAVEYGLGDAEVLALASRHVPTTEKYGAGDRLVTEVYRAVGKLRPQHQHIGRTCTAARCQAARASQSRGWAGDRPGSRRPPDGQGSGPELRHPAVDPAADGADARGGVRCRGHRCGGGASAGRTAGGWRTMTADDTPKLVTRRLADVPRERVRWLWPGYVPVGKVVVLDGDPGLGKSTVTADLAARITIGKAMPDGSGGGDPGAVVLASAEDGLADTIRPRLELAGADLTRVTVIEHLELANGSTVPLELPGDLEVLEAVVRDVGAALVTVDPLMAFLAGTVQANRDQDVRRALHPVKDMSERTGAAVLVVRHLRKAATDTAVQRGGGSIGIIGAARVGLMVARDPADADRRILAVTKSNVGAIPPAMAYRLLPDDLLGMAGVAWEGQTDHRADDLLGAPR